MRVVVGTSGFSYPDWRGNFYPKKLPESGMLSAYAERLPTVEVNNTFYGLPERSVFESWAARVPKGFTFAIKAPRRITHLSKLKNVNELLAEFVSTSQALGRKLGPLLFQLPPTFPKDQVRLTEFVAACPKKVLLAFEFRHPSWFDDSVLAKRGAALCAAEVDAEEGSGAPYVRTARFTYVRLRRNGYDEAGLAATFERIRSLAVETAYVYFKHDELGPRYAESLLARASAANPSTGIGS